MTAQRADKAGANDLWHYAVGSEKRGPVPTATVSKLLASGEISAETYVWQPGMDNWIHLGDAPGLRALVTALGGDSVEDFVEEDTAFTPADQLKASHSQLDDDDDLSQDTIVESIEVARAAAEVPLVKPTAAPQTASRVESRPAPVKAEPPAAEPAIEATVSMSAADLFGSSADEDIFASAAASDASGGVHGRRQSSVLFTLDDLGSDQRSGAKPSKDDQFVTDSSGLIDVTAIASSQRKTAQDDPFAISAPNLVIPPRTGVAPLAIPIVDRRRGLGPWILGAVAVVVVGVVALVVLTKGESKPDALAQVTPSKIEPSVSKVDVPPEPEKKPVEPKKDEVAAVADVVEPPKVDVVEPPKADVVEVAKVDETVKGTVATEVPKVDKPKAEPKVDKPKTEAKADKVEDKPADKPKVEEKVKVEVAVAPAGGNNSEKVNDLLNKLNSKDKNSGGASSEGGGDTLPDKLSAAAVRSAIKGRFGGCGGMIQNATGSVTVQTQFVISSSGVVQSARVTDGGGTSADVQKCVVGVIKSTTFGKFKDPTMQVNLPVKLL